jgi:hypothetical protein
VPPRVGVLANAESRVVAATPSAAEASRKLRRVGAEIDDILFSLLIKGDTARSSHCADRSRFREFCLFLAGTRDEILFIDEVQESIPKVSVMNATIGIFYQYRFDKTHRFSQLLSGATRRNL